jgi:hypothetical protein
VLETGLAAGVMNCRTDLGGKNGKGVLAIDFEASRPAVGLFAIATYRHTIGFRIHYLKGSIGGADSLIGSGGVGSRYDRNLHFRSGISEITILLELYPFALFTGNISTGRLQLFVQGGAGWYRFNPQAKIAGSWVNLQPLHTEGQGLGGPQKILPGAYPLRQLNVPTGLGLRWEAGSFIHLRLEGLYRVLFTDYLDDVSTRYVDSRLFAQFLPPSTASLAALASDRRKSTQPFQNRTIRGNPSEKDTFFHLQFSCSFLLNRKQKP